MTFEAPRSTSPPAGWFAAICLCIAACSPPDSPPADPVDEDMTIVDAADMATPDDAEADAAADVDVDEGTITVVIDPAMPEIVIDTTLQLSATAIDADGELVPSNFAWSSSDPEIVEVTPTGIAIGAELGTAMVTATTSEGVSGTVEVAVVPTPVAMIGVTPSQRTMNVGDTVQMTVTLRDANGGFIDETERVVEFDSDDQNVVTVSDTGLVTAVSPGEATVTVTSEGVSDTAAFTVTGPEVESISLAPASARLVKGDTVQLDVMFTWVDDNVGTEPPVTWDSTDRNVADVTDGLVEAVSEGMATIVATAAGETASASIEVVFDFESVTAGGTHACTLASKVALCWGSNAQGQLGHAQGPAPERVTTALRFDRLSAGGAHTCGVATDSKIYCWGDNQYGQLGDGTTTDRSSPTVIASNLDFAAVSAGVHHTCGVSTTGQLYCWGRGADGRLGNMATADQSAPVLAGSFVDVFAGDRHTCATKSNGDGYCWGDNDNGQLGLDGTSDLENEPTLVTGGFGFNEFSPGDSHTVGVTTSGAAAGWGLNDAGQVGDGSNIQRETPILLPGTTALSRLTAGAFHSCGIALSGDAYCWGEGGSGQLGTGNTADQNSPTMVSTTLTFTQLDGGADFTCGLTTTAEVYCWGEGALGQIGPSSNGASTPIAVF